MSYKRERSLCWNIAHEMGMPEKMMRDAVNANLHLKECVSNSDILRSRDIIISGELVAIISLQAVADSGYVDYMVAVNSLKNFSSKEEAIGTVDEWASANAWYFNKGKYKHMAKVHALYQLSQILGGAMYPPEGW